MAVGFLQQFPMLRCSDPRRAGRAEGNCSGHCTFVTKFLRARAVSNRAVPSQSIFVVVVAVVLFVSLAAQTAFRARVPHVQGITPATSTHHRDRRSLQPPALRHRGILIACQRVRARLCGSRRDLRWLAQQQAQELPAFQHPLRPPRLRHRRVSALRRSAAQHAAAHLLALPLAPASLLMHSHVLLQGVLVAERALAARRRAGEGLAFAVPGALVDVQVAHLPPRPARTRARSATATPHTQRQRTRGRHAGRTDE